MPPIDIDDEHIYPGESFDPLERANLRARMISVHTTPKRAPAWTLPLVIVLANLLVWFVL